MQVSLEKDSYCRAMHRYFEDEVETMKKTQIWPQKFP